MTIEEILLLDDTEKIKQLKNGRGSDLPDIEQIKKWLDPKEHQVFDKALRPVKKRSFVKKIVEVWND